MSSSLTSIRGSFNAPPLKSRKLHPLNQSCTQVLMRVTLAFKVERGRVESTER